VYPREESSTISPFSLEDYGALVVGSFLRTHTHDEFEESYLINETKRRRGLYQIPPLTETTLP
jgi:hypothetical protein